MSSLVTQEIEYHTAKILAAETWAKRYTKTPELHKKLIRTEATLESAIRKWLHDLSLNKKLIRWDQYKGQVQSDVQVDVYIDEAELQTSTRQFINVVLQDITTAVALGAASGDQLYAYKLGLGTSDAAIQRIALDHSAQLVGKKVLPDGSIIDNVMAGLDITKQTRRDIQQSIHTSIALGENAKDAAARLQSVIDNPTRAGLISRTEVVNSFGMGLSEYGRQSGAVGKEWQDTGADDICAENSAAGVIPFDGDFPSGDSEPTAHPNCRCSMRLVFQNEVDENPDMLNQ
jgi:hypothetical protein